MKVSIILLSIFITFVVASPAKLRLKTLYERSWDVLYTADDEDLNILKNSDQNCMRRKLKLSEYGNKFISQDLGSLAFSTVALICLSDEEKVKILPFEKKIGVIREVREYLEDELNCIKNKLSRIEPTSELLQGFTPTNNPEEKCESFEYVQAVLSEQFNEFKERFSKIGLQNCSAASEHEAKIKVNFSKLAIVALKQTPVQSEINKLKQEFVRDEDIFNQNFLQCVLNKINE